MRGKKDCSVMLRLRSGEFAFTLVELLCVLAILGLLAAAAVPALAGFNEGRALDLAARSVALDMRRAQQAAITSGFTSEMRFYEFQNKYRLIDRASGDSIMITLPEGISIHFINFIFSGGTHNLNFLRTGAPNRGGTICLRNKRGELRYIIVTPATGRVRVSQSPPDHWEIP